MRPRYLLLAALLAPVARAAGEPNTVAAPDSVPASVAVAGGAAISFAAALGLGESAPRAEGARRALAVKQAGDAHISRLTLNPQLSVQPGYRLMPQASRDVEVVVELLQGVNLGGHAGARRASTRAEEAVLSMEVRAQVLTQRLGIARAWIDVWSAERVLAVARSEEGVAAELERLVEKAAKAEASTRADLLEARSFHSEVRLQALAAEGEVHDRGLELSRELGRASMTPLSTAGTLPEAELPESTPAAVLIEQLARVPAVQLRVLLARAEAARAVEERAARATLLHVGAVAQRDAPGGLVLSGLVRVTPALFDRGQREHAAMAATAARLEGEARAELVDASAQLGMALHEVEHTRELRDELRDGLVPSSRQGAVARRRIFQAGEATLFEVLHAERTAMAAQSRLEAATAAHAWARVRTWLLLASMEGRP